MTFTLKLSKPSVQELHQAIHHARLLGELKTVQRCSALLFLDAGNDQSTVASCLNVSIRAVQRWVGAFVGGGVGALHVKKPSGRPPKLTPSQKKQLKAHLQKGPEAWGYATGVWTSALIQDHLATTFQVSYSVFYISQLLRNLGMSFIKPKTYYAQDPDDMKKQLSWIREEYPALYKEVLEKHGVLFFQDESSFQLQSNAVRTWPVKGNAQLVKKNPKRGSIRILGAIELFSGDLTYEIVKGRMHNEVFAQFLKRLAWKYSAKDMYVVMDNAPYHQGPHVRRRLGCYDRLHLKPLPKRSPHLNPIEKLWKEVKRRRTHLRYFPSTEELLSAIRSGLRLFQRDPDSVKSLMGKWERVGQDPQGARQGKYDSSFIPEKFKRESQSCQKKAA